MQNAVFAIFYLREPLASATLCKAWPYIKYGLRPYTFTPKPELMQKIEAIIRPFKLEEVKANLLRMGLHGATVSEVWVGRQRIGRQNGIGRNRNGSSGRDGFLPRVRLEMVVPDERWQEAATAIVRAAKTGKYEDGKIFVTEVVDSVHIRTGEHDMVSHAGNGAGNGGGHFHNGEHDTVGHAHDGQPSAVAV